MNRLNGKGGTSYIGVDLGTTTTRVWLIVGGSSVHRLATNFGVRNTAKDGHNEGVRSILRKLIAQQQETARKLGTEPAYVIGAGMLTSALGLAEVPYIDGPVDSDMLRRGVAVHKFPDLTSLPVMLVPGVRTGIPGAEAWEIGSTDVIRGEETLCTGLLAMGVLHRCSMLLNLGSHWKAILLDDQSRVHKSSTNLSGELMLGVLTQTILASSVPADRPERLDESWVRHGIQEERRSGLARALFCVRLLELDGRTDPLQRLSYLTGSFISHTLSSLSAQALIRDHAVICGSVGIAGMWKLALSEHGVDVEDYSERTEEVFIRGLEELSRPI